MMTADDYINRVVDYMPRATPLRSQIATELRGLIAERLANGQRLDDVLRNLGDPAALADSYLSAVPLSAVSFWRRAAAKIVDLLIIVTPIIALAVFVWTRSEPGFLQGMIAGVALISSGIIFGAYSAVAECLTGQTFGKHLMGIRVVRESGARISAGQAIVRNLPLVLQVFWIDAMFALATDKAQRAFELLSKTRVVRAEREEAV